SLKKIAPPANPELLEAQIEALRKQATEKAGQKLDAELATALAATDLMQSERAGQPSEALEALKQWCGLHLHDPKYRDWVSFRFPESIDHFDLVELRRPNSQLAEELIGPDE